MLSLNARRSSENRCKVGARKLPCPSWPPFARSTIRQPPTLAPLLLLHPARRHGRILRFRRIARPARTARQAGRRWRAAGPARRRLRGELRSAKIRHSIGDAAAHGGDALPARNFSRPRHHLYSEWSDRVAAILGKYSPVVEMASVDEAYLDLAGTERMHGPPLAAAHALLREITATTGFRVPPASRRTRLVAKVASDQAKPRGLVWVPAGARKHFSRRSACGAFPESAKSPKPASNARGIETVGQLAARHAEKLEENSAGGARRSIAKRAAGHLRIFRGRRAEIHFAQPHLRRGYRRPRHCSIRRSAISARKR